MADEDQEKALYLSQIQILRQEVERSQLRYNELLKQNKYLMWRSRSMDKDRNDIVEYLQQEVAAEEGKVQEFQEMLDHQKEASDRAMEALKVELRGEVEQVQKKMEELTLGKETLASAHDEHMEELQAELKCVEKRRLIQMEERRREAALLLLRDKHHLEKKQFLEKLEKKIEDELMVKLLRRFIKQRNDHEQRLKVHNLLTDDNKVLSKKVDDLRREQSKSTSEVKDLMKTLRLAAAENIVHQKEVQKMLRWYERLRSEVLQRRISHEKQRRHQQAQIDALRRRLESASGRLHKKTARVNRLEAELQMTSSRSRGPCRRKTLPSPSDSGGDVNERSTDQLHV